VEIGAVKEQLYKDKDGKIGLTFIIKDEAKAKAYLTPTKSGGGTSSGGTTSGGFVRGKDTSKGGTGFGVTNANK
jgi:hypothetical protein